MPPTRPLRPVNPDNARTPRITAAAGTELAGAYSAGTVRSRPRQKGFTTRGPSSSPSLADHPLRPATRHRLGAPLPHQPPDGPRPPPPAAEAFPPPLLRG